MIFFLSFLISVKMIFTVYFIYLNECFFQFFFLSLWVCFLRQIGSMRERERERERETNWLTIRFHWTSRELMKWKEWDDSMIWGGATIGNRGWSRSSTSGQWGRVILSMSIHFGVMILIDHVIRIHSWSLRNAIRIWRIIVKMSVQFWCIV